MRIDVNHFTILVRNLEKALTLYSDLLGFERPKTGRNSKIIEVDEPGGFKLRYASLQMNEYLIKFAEPIEGPRVKLLEERGEGLYLIAFRVDNIEEFYNEMKKRGITPTDRYGNPLIDKKYYTSPTGAKILYLPPEEACGTHIEVFELV